MEALAENSPEDTSLALPNETSTRGESHNRSLRVKQQFQLSLKRVAQRSQSTGARANTTNTADAADEFSMKTMVNTSTPLRSYSLPVHAQKLYRRMAVPPKPCQDLPSTSSSLRYNRMNTVSVAGHSDVKRNLTKSYSTSLPHRTSLNVPQGKQLCSSSKPCENFSQVSSMQTGGSASVKVHQNGSWLNQRQSTTNTKRPTEATLGTQLSKWKLGSKDQKMTLQKAMDLLSNRNDEDKLIAGASYIQSQCFHEEDARIKVWELGGIQKLLNLLTDSSEDVQSVVARALRNAVYQNNDNKLKVQSCNGVKLILDALSNSCEQETKRQLSGLLWNLSSLDSCKEMFPMETASVLTKVVLVPSSGIFKGENPKHELQADADALHTATGCLRNLSSGSEHVRNTLRECENLIDCLIFYIQGTVANNNVDDKPTEHSVCILSNLTFEFEPKSQQNYVQQPSESQENSSDFSCLIHHAAKSKEDLKKQSLLLEEKEKPLGSEWLWSPITIRLYLSLVACSKQFHTQAAAIGALQNTTAGKGAMSKIVVATLNKEQQKLKDIGKVSKEGDNEMKMKAILNLIRNLSLHHELHPIIVSEMLPQIMDLLLHEDLTCADDEKMMILCQTLINLVQNSPNTIKAILQQKVLERIEAISSTDKTLNKASQKASVLLHMMWEDKGYKKALKKMGFEKTFFINKRTKAALKQSARNSRTPNSSHDD